MRLPTLAELLTIQDDQKTQLDPLIQFKAKFDSPEALTREQLSQFQSYMKQIDMALLIKFATLYPAYSELCLQPMLKTIWDEKWQRCGETVVPMAPAPQYHYQPQFTISSFVLLQGVFFYAHYKKGIESEDLLDNNNAQEFLMLAARYGYFPALNQLCTSLLKQSHSDPRALPLCLKYAERAAELYLAPGYLLLALTYFQQKDYLISLRFLMLAEMLIPYSQVFINNAYQGMAIDDIIKPAFGSWAHGKTTLAALAQIPLHVVTGNLDKDIRQERDRILEKLPIMDSIAATSSDENGLGL